MQMRWRALAVSTASALLVVAVALADPGHGHGSQGHQNEGGNGGNQGHGNKGDGNNGQGNHGGNGNGTCIQGCVTAARACRLAAHTAAKQCAQTCDPQRAAVRQNCAVGDGVSDQGTEGDGVSDQGAEDGVSDNGAEPTPSAACEDAIQALKTCLQGCQSPPPNAAQQCLTAFQACKSTQCGLPPGPTPGAEKP